MQDWIGDWLMEAWWAGCDLAGLALFWQGQTLWFLLLLFVAINLVIPAGILLRCCRRTVTDLDFPSLASR